MQTITVNVPQKTATLINKLPQNRQRQILLLPVMPIYLCQIHIKVLKLSPLNIFQILLFRNS